MSKNKPRYKKGGLFGRNTNKLARGTIKPKPPTAVSKFEKEDPTYAQNIENTTNLSDITMRSSLLNDMCGGGLDLGLFNKSGKCVNKKLQREARRVQKKKMRKAKRRINSGG